MRHADQILTHGSFLQVTLSLYQLPHKFSLLLAEHDTVMEVGSYSCWWVFME